MRKTYNRVISELLYFSVPFNIAGGILLGLYIADVTREPMALISGIICFVAGLFMLRIFCSQLETKINELERYVNELLIHGGNRE